MAASSISPSAPGCRAIGLKCRAINRSSPDSVPLVRLATASPRGGVELGRTQLPRELVEHRIDHAGFFAVDEGVGDIDIFCHDNAGRHVVLAIELIDTGAQDRANDRL